MISLELSVRQADCPLTAASGAHDVAFVTPHWHYHHERSRLELRVLAEAGGRDALETLRRHDADGRSSRRPSSRPSGPATSARRCSRPVGN